jgi:hypothetical protein
MMRRASTCLALLGLAVLGLPAVASATPKVSLKVKAVPIPGFPGTGNILGAGADVEVEYKISGTEYGGFPPPLTGVIFDSPAGVKLISKGFVTCPPATLEAKGPGGCPKKSIASPKGEVLGIVSFGTSRVEEKVVVQAFFAPGGGLSFDAEGESPAKIELVSKGHFTSTSPPFGPKLVTAVPLVETVPGAPDGSILSIKIKVGAAYKKGKKTISYINLPKKCPKGGFPVKSELIYGGEGSNGLQSGVPVEIVPVTYNAPCPKKK